MLDLKIIVAALPNNLRVWGQMITYMESKPIFLVSVTQHVPIYLDSSDFGELLLKISCGNVIFFYCYLIISTIAAVESLQKRIHIDPCSPKGYSHDMQSWKLSADSLDENNNYISALQAGGNFSECRSAALMLLQKGKG